MTPFGSASRMGFLSMLWASRGRLDRCAAGSERAERFSGRPDRGAQQHQVLEYEARVVGPEVWCGDQEAQGGQQGECGPQVSYARESRGEPARGDQVGQ